LLVNILKKKLLKEDKNIKIQFFLNTLNFINPRVISVLKENNINPFFGGIRNGTFKGFIRGGHIKEYINRFLLPRWYRLQRFNFYKIFLERKVFLYFNFIDYRNCSRFSQNIIKQKTIKIFCHFYIRKRWDLINIFK